MAVGSSGDEPPEGDDWLTRAGERLPVSPLSVLGSFLAVLIVLQSFVDAQANGEPVLQVVIAAALPVAVAVSTVLVDRHLVRDGVSVRDRITVFSFALGGFLVAAVITALQLVITIFDGAAVAEPLFLTLVSGTVGVGAGSVAGAAEVRQREATRQARRERERLEEFASIVSHDLRNPLEVSQGYLDAAFETGDAEHLLRVEDSLDRMEELIEQSLALARKGRVVDETEPLAFGDVAEEAWDVVETPEATLAVDESGTIEADEGRLRELFENLFRNALEHVGEGVTVTVGRLDGTATDDATNDEMGPAGFYVDDDGPGIPPDERDEVFERGYTTEVEGSGLGLAIVRAIAEAHGWDVGVTESESGGARFEFRTE
ncbi:MAG TPA: HAMP domain-containing sensor histidine kinase [Natrialbaceae archaeon]|nr:HAMP domain-containing sensor histidine kinase [Natrialbaceae archaeon]